jgi:hypothetical protein
MMVDGEWVEVEHDEVRGSVRIRHASINGGEWVEEQSDETRAIIDRHGLYSIVRRLFRGHRTRT